MARHDREVLGVYSLGALDDRQSMLVEEHLTECAGCRAELERLVELRPLLDLLPPEAFADSPQWTRWPRGGWARVGLVLAVAAVLAAAVAGGVLIGRGGEEQPALPQQAPGLAPPQGTRFASGTDPTGASLSVRLEPAGGWVRVSAVSSGIRAGERCRLVVVSRTGERQLSGSWLVSAISETSGTSVDGAALVAPEDVVAVRIENFDGRVLVSVSL
ncbi:MAG: zf-HC2 domain-containing protein [Labedaea sp.]